VIGKSSFSGFIRSLKANGIYLLANTGARKVRKLMTTGQKLILGKRLIYRKLKTAIGKRYSLEQIPEAHRYVDEGKKIGNVVITIS